MNDFSLTQVNDLLFPWLNAMFVTTVIGGVIVLVALMINWVTSKRVQSRWLYLLWVLVLFRFALFATPESPTSMLNVFSHEDSVVQVSVADVTTSVDSLWVPTVADTAPTIQSSPIFQKAVIESPSSLDMVLQNKFAIAAAVWMLGFLCLMLKFVIAIVRVLRLISRSALPSKHVVQQFADVQRRLGMRSNSRVRTTDQIAAPAMFGIFRPVILLPAWCVEELDQQQLDHVLLHELVHVRRLDGLVQLTTYFIAAIHWFNPLVWLANRFANSTRELSCDQRVVDLLMSATHRGPDQICQQYGRTIIDVAERAMTGNQQQTNYAAVIGGFTGFKQKLIKQRIAMLVHDRQQHWLRAMMLACSVLLLIATGFTSAQQSSEQAGKLNPEPPMVKEEFEIQLMPSAQAPQEPAKPETLKPIVRNAYDRSDAIDVASVIKAGITLDQGQSKRMCWRNDIPELNYDSKIAKATPMSPNEFLIEGVSPGQTTLELKSPNHETVKLKVVVRRPPSDPEVVVEAFVEEKQLDVDSLVAEGVSLVQFKTKRLKWKRRIVELIVYNSEITKAELVSPNEVILKGLSPGQTTLELKAPSFETVKLQVVVNRPARKKSLESDVLSLHYELNAHFFKREVVFLRLSKDKKSVVLSGQVPISKIRPIEKYVAEHTSLAIINRLSERQAISIEVRSYALSRSKFRELDISFPTQDANVEKSLTHIEELDLVGYLKKGSSDDNAYDLFSVAANRLDPLNKFLQSLERHNVVKPIDQVKTVTFSGKMASVRYGQMFAPMILGKKEHVHLRLSFDLRPIYRYDDQILFELRAGTELSIPKKVAQAKNLGQFRFLRVNTGARLNPRQSIALVTDTKMGMEEPITILHICTPKMLEMTESEFQKLSKERARAIPLELMK